MYQRRSSNNEAEITATCLLGCNLKSAGRQILSEQNNVGPHRITTIEAHVWTLFSNREIKPRTAGNAARLPDAAMQFDHVTRTRPLMKAINVLCHEGE